MCLYEGGADPSSSSLVATGSILLGTEGSDVMKDPLSDEDIVLNVDDYDLYLWFDGDNARTSMQFGSTL